MSVDVTPDPKPERQKEPMVYAEFHAQHHVCVHCGAPWPTAAHLLRGVLREDHIDALVPLCGGGSSRCHGAFDSGHAYTSSVTFERVTPADVKRSVAKFLASPEGQRQAAYLVRKLGGFGAEAYRLRLLGVL